MNPGSLSTARLTLCIALAYALLGAFGLMLAIGPGYASPIFPAAGLSLVALLWFGRRALPGVWLGSVVMNMLVALLHDSLSPTTAALALLIACGATAQARVGSWLVNHWQRSAWRNLERELDACIFLLLGGVLSCLLSSAVGVTGLYATGVIKPGDVLFSYWNWYVGDTLGVLVFAPLLLRILNSPADSRIDWQRLRFAFTPMLLILGLLWLAFYGSAHVILKEQEYRLKTDCEAITSRINDRLLTHREVLTSLRNFIEATPGFSFTQFELFTKITLQDNPDIFALSFNDLVAIDQRPAYERRISSLSPLGPFRITERDSQRRLTVAAERPEYVAVRYIVPLTGNVPAVGFDINSEPIRRDAINRAKATQSMAVTAPIQLVQEQKKRVGVLELMPVPDNPETADGARKSRNLLGFAVSVVKIDEMIEIATRGHVPDGLLFQVTDPNAPKGKELLYRSGNRSVGTGMSELPGDWKAGLRMGDRDWKFTARATDAYLQHNRPLLAWFMGGIAIVITGLIQLLIIGMNGRMSEIRRTNDAVNSSLDNLFNYANVPIIVWDSNNRITRFSRAFELLSGRSAAEVIAQDISAIFRDCDINSSLKNFNTKLTSERWESVEIPVRHVNGTVSTVLWNVSAIIDDDSAPVATIAQGHDITARKRLEDELQQRTHALGDANALLEQEMAERQMAQEALAVKQAQLVTLNNTLKRRIAEALAELRQKDQLMISQSRQAAMGEMIGNIAHQWRQPLNALAMVLGNIQQAYQYNELTTRYINEAVENGNRLIQKMSTTINDFRDFFLPDKEAVSFSALSQVTHALSLVEAGLKNQNIEIHLEAPQDVMLTGFPNEFSQVILNLLSNAREAVKGKCVLAGIIEIRVFERDGFGCVAISDNGGGIAVDVIDKIFEPYFSTKAMGTGIGLYMSKMIIERSMNGTIEAHNSAGGAVFVVSIPL
ncbi:MAG: CHASE domain-containing protein [Desulfuromonadaceae bacterium]